jgi:hypothetical protein
MRNPFTAASVSIAAVVTAIFAVRPASAADVDIYGRTVPDSQGSPTIVVFANHATEKAVQNTLPDLSARLCSESPLVIVHIDLRGLPHLFQGFAENDIRSQFKKGVSQFKAGCRQRGLVPSAAPESRLFFVEDVDGAPHAALGLPKDFRQALAIAYDSDGRDVVRGAFPQNAPAIEDALRGDSNGKEQPGGG